MARRRQTASEAAPQSTRVDWLGPSALEHPESPLNRCARGEHEQVESEPWRCAYSEHHVDVNPPDSGKLVLVFCSWLVAERSDSHNWTLKQRRKVEGGANAGKHAWRDVGFYGTPGQAATKALHLMTEQQLGPGSVFSKYLVAVMNELEERLRGTVEQAAAAEARAKAFAEALSVVKGEEDRARIQKLMVGPQR